MTAVFRDGDTCYSNVGERCTFCNRKAAFPYVDWLPFGEPYRDENPNSCGAIIICSDCCRELKRGLMADMVRVVAAADFRLLAMADYRSGRVRRREDLSTPPH
jgi:hypothetical protein